MIQWLVSELIMPRWHKVTPFPRYRPSTIYFTSTIDPHHCQQNPAERLREVYKKDTNTTLDLNFAPIYVRTYTLFTWFIIAYYLDKHANGGILLRILSSILTLTPFISCITKPGNPSTIDIWRRIIPSSSINLSNGSDSIIIFLSWRSLWTILFLEFREGGVSES